MNDAPDEDAKVIVRSNGTVTYVGKDIAYHLWKFGLLGQATSATSRSSRTPTTTCWISTSTARPSTRTLAAPHAIYNVIDSRQSDPQNNVIQALRGMGHTDAGRPLHPLLLRDGRAHPALRRRTRLRRAAKKTRSRAYIEVSGRKGFGVKADDLIDTLIAATRRPKWMRARPRSRRSRAPAPSAAQIAIGALRYFMLKFTRNTVIAFDFKDALSFEGETGPYVQYAVVRAANIFRKGRDHGGSGVGAS